MKKKNNLFYKVLNHGMLILISASCLIPFLLVLSVSLTSETAIYAFGYKLIPRVFSLEAYQYIFKSPDEIVSSYLYTVIITLVGTISATLITSMVAYSLSRKKFKYRNSISFFLYFPMLFSGGLVPTYLLVAKYLHMKDTIYALFIPILLGSWSIFMLRVFFQGIPDSLVESASIEGASEFTIFFKIAVPLGKVGIAIIALFASLGFWNDWFQSMLYIDRSNIMTLQYMLYRILNKVNLSKEMGSTGLTLGKLPEENLRMALCVVAAGPMLFIYPFFQKYFAKGITLGSVKG